MVVFDFYLSTYNILSILSHSSQQQNGQQVHLNLQHQVLPIRS